MVAQLVRQLWQQERSGNGRYRCALCPGGVPGWHASSHPWQRCIFASHGGSLICSCMGHAVRQGKLLAGPDLKCCEHSGHVPALAACGVACF